MAARLLEYTKDTASWFGHIADQPYAIFIDSCQHGQRGGRFDIISASPSTVIKTYGNNNHVIRQTETSVTTTDVFELIKNHLSQMNTTDIDAVKDMPFRVGALGYIGYDTVHQLEKLPYHQHHDITLPDAIIGLYDWSIVVDHQQQQSWLFSLHDNNHPTTQSILHLIQQPPQKTISFQLTHPFATCITEENYHQAFFRLKKHIKDGDCYQANLCQRFNSSYSGDPWQAYQRLRQQHPSPFSAYFNTPDGQLLSHSPERFIQVRNQQVITQPIKGTSPRYSDPDKDKTSAQSLLNSSKDHAENSMIVDLLRNDLAKTCKPFSIDVPKLCELESFPNVHHLVSTITATLESQHHSMDLLKHSFPGGSITGAPKLRAMEIIADLEPYHRSAYCGTAFYCDPNGAMDSNILIRSLICCNGNIYAYAGGGIVHDSQVDSEYQETLVKISSLLTLLENNFLTKTNKDTVNAST